MTTPTNLQPASREVVADIFLPDAHARLSSKESTCTMLHHWWTQAAYEKCRDEYKYQQSVTGILSTYAHGKNINLAEFEMRLIPKFTPENAKYVEAKREDLNYAIGQYVATYKMYPDRDHPNLKDIRKKYADAAITHALWPSEANHSTLGNRI